MIALTFILRMMNPVNARISMANSDELSYNWNNDYCCCIDYSVLMLGMIYNYMISRNVFGISSTPSYTMDISAFYVRLAFPADIIHYYLTLA